MIPDHRSCVSQAAPNSSSSWSGISWRAELSCARGGRKRSLDTVRRLKPAKETAASHPPRQSEIVLNEYLRNVPAFLGPIVHSAFEPGKVDWPPNQWRLRKYGDLAGKFAATGLEFFVPIGGLQPVEAIGQHDFWEQSPHGAADQRAICAFGQILLRRNAETVREYVEVDGRVAHFNAGNGLFGGTPVATVIDLEEPPDAFVPPHAIVKIVSVLLGA